MEGRELRALTALRFGAAAGVLYAHAGGAGGIAVAHWSMTTFFCLSGFVLTWRYRGRVEPGRYALARFARIYPLFLVVLLVNAFAGAPPAGALALHALLLEPWFHLAASDPFFAVSWSLGVEAFLYACFPLIAPALARRSRAGLAAVAAACLLAAIAAAILVPAGGFDRFVYFFPLGRLPDFVLGCCAGELAARGVRARWWMPAPALAPLALLLGSALAKDALILPVVALALPAIAGARVPDVFVRLGAASYALYLVHPLVLGALPVAAAAPAAVLLALALHLRLEQPARRWVAGWRLPRAAGGLARGVEA